MGVGPGPPAVPRSIPPEPAQAPGRLFPPDASPLPAVTARDASTDDESITFSPLHGLLAWLWPGLGHIVHGDVRRGRLIMGGMLLMVLGGLFVGGIDVVDRRNDRLWFLGQMLCGPGVIACDVIRERTSPAQSIDWTTGDARRAIEAGDEEAFADAQRVLHRASVGHLNEIGTLSITLAGLMNFVVILDAMFWRPRPTTTPGRRAEDTT